MKKSYFHENNQVSQSGSANTSKKNGELNTYNLYNKIGDLDQPTATYSMQMPQSRALQNNFGSVNRQTSIRSHGERIDDKLNFINSEAQPNGTENNSLKFIVEVDTKSAE